MNANRLLMQYNEVHACMCVQYVPGVNTVNEGMVELFCARSVPMGNRPSAITPPSPGMAATAQETLNSQ